MKTPWSYDVFESELNPRHNRGTVYDAESAVMCQVRGADAREITSLIVEAVNGRDRLKAALTLLDELAEAPIEKKMVKDFRKEHGL